MASNSLDLASLKNVEDFPQLTMAYKKKKKIVLLSHKQKHRDFLAPV